MTITCFYSPKGIRFKLINFSVIYLQITRLVILPLSCYKFTCNTTTNNKLDEYFYFIYKNLIFFFCFLINVTSPEIFLAKKIA